jgi:hypothetical protein
MAIKNLVGGPTRTYAQFLASLSVKSPSIRSGQVAITPHGKPAASTRAAQSLSRHFKNYR